MVSRRYNSIRNIIWAVLNKIVAILLPFVARTTMIYYLGVEFTGLGSLFTSVLTVLSLAELGFSSAMVFSMYGPINRSDKNKLCALLSFYRVVYCGIGGIVLIVGVALMPFIPLLIKGKVSAGINIYVLYSIYLINTVIGYFLFAYKSSLLTAYQRGDVVSKIGLGFNAGMYAFQIVALIATRNFYIYAVALPVSTVLMSVVCDLESKRLYPDIICKGKLDASSIHDIGKRVSGVFLYKLSSTTRTSFDSIVISASLGLTALTQYQNYYMIISSISGMLNVTINAITASVGDSIVSKSKEDNYRDFKTLVFIYMSVVSVCTVCIACLIQPFMKLWVGNDLTMPNVYAILFALYFYIQAMGDIVYLYRTAAGLWWQDRIRPVVEAVANIALNLILVRIFGFAGVLLATITTLLLINFGWGAWILFKHYFQHSMNKYFEIQGRQFFEMIVAVSAAFFFSRMIAMPGLSGLIIQLFLALLVSLAVLYAFSYRSDLFREGISFVKGTLRIFSK